MQSSEIAAPVPPAPTELVDLSDYCRLCLQLPDECELLDLQIIYDEEEQLSYNDCLTICAQIDLSAGGDYAPHQLCKSCGLELQVAYDFHKKVEESKKFLMQWQKSTTAMLKEEAAVTTEETLLGEEEEDVVLANNEAEDKSFGPQILLPAQLESEPPDENDGQLQQTQQQQQHESDDGSETKLREEEVEKTREQVVAVAEHLNVSMEYEALEEDIDIDDYQSVDELVDEDEETVQILIEEKEYMIQEQDLCANSKTKLASVCKSVYEESSASTDITKTSSNSSNDQQMNVDSENNIYFEYDSAESDFETKNNKGNTRSRKQVQMQKDATVRMLQTEGTKTTEATKTAEATKTTEATKITKATKTPIETKTPEDTKTTTTTRTTTATPVAAIESDLKSVVITKTGEIQPRRRYNGQHSCDYCQKVFKNRSRMLTHRRSHEPDRPKHVCDECGRCYTTKQALSVHVNTIHSRNGLTCPVCGKVYAVKKLLEVHMRYHTGDFPYVCDLCGRKFAQMSHLTTHKNVKHNDARYTCEHPGCGKFFTSSASLRNHEYSHGEMPFECFYCKRGYPAKSKLKVHIRQKHGLEVSLDQVEEMRTEADEQLSTLNLEEEFIHLSNIESAYAESTEYYSHDETEEEGVVTYFSAATQSDTDDLTLEEYIFENQDSIRNPEKVDTKITEPQQQQPDSSTSAATTTTTTKRKITETTNHQQQQQPADTTQRRRHGRAPIIPGGPPFQCEYCDHKSPTRTLLASHRHRKHRFNKPSNKCEKCNKDFTTKQQLERHQQRVSCHSYPVFKCEYCEKSCIGRANYLIHLRFHKKVYPYVCHICAKPFMMTQHLSQHVKTKHEGQRFICEFENCSKMFQTAHALKNHAYTHLEQLPYRCEYCQRDFATKGRLRWHISRLHGVEHTLDELDSMRIANEITLKAQLRPALTPVPIDTIEVLDEDVLEC